MKQKFYYVIYDEEEFPIAYCDSLEEIRKFADKKASGIRQIVDRAVRGKTRIVIRGQKCTIARYNAD